MTDDDTEERGRLALGRRLVANALRYSAASVSRTAALRELKHDADLLPRILKQLRALLDGFHRDSLITYDIQGRSDHGCDLLVRLETGPGCSFVGLQVKSHNELADEKVVNKLIVQHSTACDHYSPMLDFYIVLSADVSNKGKHQAVIRVIQQAFAVKARVSVVDPQYVATFLNLSRSAMDGLVTRTMRTGDPVMTAASADISRHPLHAAIILLFITRIVEGVMSYSLDELLADRWLQAVGEAIPIARLEGTPHGRPYDRPYRNEMELRDAMRLPPVPDDVEMEVRDEDDLHSYYYYRETGFFPDISNNLLRHFLSADTASERAAARLTELMPEVINLLEDDDLSWLDTGRERLALKVEEHAALLCLAAEGKERHELEGRELVNYLVQLLLPDEP